MKSASPAMKAHLNGDVTTLCSCWKIVRKDGVVMGFTDLDRDIVYGDIVYHADSGFNRTAISNDGSFSVDNLDVGGFFDSELITTIDLRNGAFNFADVYVFMLNWQDLSQGEIRLRRGWFGETDITEDGQFRIELRGMTQALSHEMIENYSPECRADFCDKRCKLDLADFSTRSFVKAQGDRRSYFFANQLPAVPTQSTSKGAHRTWGIRVAASAGGTAGYDYAEIRLYDQEGGEAKGGSTGSNLPKGFKFDSMSPGKARDGKGGTSFGVYDVEFTDPNNQTVTITSTGVIWWVTFGDEVDVKEVEVIADDRASAPSSFDLLYTDDDPTSPNANWTVAKFCTYNWQVDGQSALWAIGSETSDPISAPTTSTGVPAPFTGASTYVGGTVTWVTGKNRGRSIEITAFDAATNRVTLFENMIFEIGPGDLFDIAQGCVKTRDNCKLYDNILNFRGEPDVPGQDQYLSYPDSK